MDKIKETNKLNMLMEVECKSDSTIRSYEKHIKTYTDYYGESPEPKHIIDHLYYLKKFKGYEGTSLNAVKAALKYYYTEVLGQDIAIKLPIIKKRKSDPKPLPREIILKLIENTPNLKYKLLIELTYGSGLRLDEVITLKVNDVELETGIIRLERGKGDKDRSVLISNVALTHLRKYLKERYNQSNPYIFDSTDRPTTHICSRSFQETLKRSATKAGITCNIHPHLFRHSFATHLLEREVPIQKVQKLLGHSNIKTTMRYTRVVNDFQNIQSPMDDEYFREKEVTRSTEGNS